MLFLQLCKGVIHFVPTAEVVKNKIVVYDAINF